MRITIHQPEHLPWLGFFHKISMADTYVVLGDVQFRKNYFQNRNKIRTSKGPHWITVPIKNRFGQNINDVLIDNADIRWKRKYWDNIYFSYKKASFFEKYADSLHAVLDGDWQYLADLNLALIRRIMEFLNLNAKVLTSSELQVEGKGSSLLLDICKKLGAATYISGVSGKEYLDMNSFKQAGIQVLFQEFHHPIYKQCQAEFLPCMSVIDLLFNYGQQSMEVINGVNIPVMDELFL